MHLTDTKPIEEGFYIWSPFEGSLQPVEVFKGIKDRLYVVGGTTGNREIGLVDGKWSSKVVFAEQIR
jgi:hypothetical protein